MCSRSRRRLRIFGRVFHDCVHGKAGSSTRSEDTRGSGRRRWEVATSRARHLASAAVASRPAYSCPQPRPAAHPSITANSSRSEVLTAIGKLRHDAPRRVQAASLPYQRASPYCCFVSQAEPRSCARQPASPPAHQPARGNRGAPLSKPWKGKARISKREKSDAPLEAASLCPCRTATACDGYAAVLPVQIRHGCWLSQPTTEPMPTSPSESRRLACFRFRFLLQTQFEAPARHGAGRGSSEGRGTPGAGAALGRAAGSRHGSASRNAATAMAAAP